MTDSSNSSGARSLQTRIVHPEDQLTPGFDSFSMPVTRASTVVFPNLAAMRALVWSDDSQWRYGLHATPTSLALAQRLARELGEEARSGRVASLDALHPARDPLPDLAGPVPRLTRSGQNLI